MRRDHYRIFSEGHIGPLLLPNRLVRSATWDPVIIHHKTVTEEDSLIYRRLSEGGVGLIITGGLPVIRESLPGSPEPAGRLYPYEELRVDGIEILAAEVHEHGSGCKVLAQLETGYLNAGPSDFPSPFRAEPLRELAVAEIAEIVNAFVTAIADIKAAGFDGVQLHAAHGGLLSAFLSPYTNRRQDGYGGSIKNRVRIIAEIVSGARAKTGDFPILIKLNGTDFIPGGIDRHNFPEIAAEVVKTGVDAVEISGGMWECLVRSKEELGFRPVPSPESHTCIWKPSQQSYFFPYAAELDLAVPVILVGGNRDIESLEEIMATGMVDFIAMCRPLIREPGLPNRWLAGKGNSTAACVSCNSCLYDMYMHPGRNEPGPVRCIQSRNRKIHHQAQKWLVDWVKGNIHLSG